MNTTVIRYKVKADRAAENEQYISAVFAQLERESPAGLRYAAFRLEDGVSFMHLVRVETPDGADPLKARDTFQAFVAGIRDRCEEPPTFAELTQIGAYRFFGDV